MNKFPKKIWNFSRWMRQIIGIFFSVIIFVGCKQPPINSTEDLAQETNPQPTSYPQALITFRVITPAKIPHGEALYLSILDEVTGLAFNQKLHVMQAENPNTFTVIIPAQLGSVIKYRYLRQGEIQNPEHTTDGRPVRYRLYVVQGPGVVEDLISRWTDQIFSLDTGRIIGKVINAENDQPIPNIMITAGGAYTISAADGGFLLEGLPPGTHNLVAYAMDGRFQPYQQGALVAPGSSTPAVINLSAAEMVNLTFLVNVPPDTPENFPICIAGNLSQLGNTFADLFGGINGLAAQMPILTPQADGKMAISLSLPSGTDLRYKYTLGDGLWSAEQSSSAAFPIRHLIVPNQDQEIYDTIESWNVSQKGITTFQVTIPANVVEPDRVYIQFNPGFGWMEPLPMASSILESGKQTWRFQLSSPLGNIDQLEYRYCRSIDCELSIESGTQLPRVVQLQTQPQIHDDRIQGWEWYANLKPAIVPNQPVFNRGATFIAGIELDPKYQPSNNQNMPSAISEIASLGGNWIFLSPTWTYIRLNPPVLSPVPGSDISYPDLSSQVNQSLNLGMKVGLYPTPNFIMKPVDWFNSSDRDFSWWVAWFESYQNFLLNFAEISSRMNIEALVIGGYWVETTIPSNLHTDQFSNTFPQDANARWSALIQNIRARYSGKLIWAMSYNQAINNPPSFLGEVDLLSIEISSPLIQDTELTTDEELYKSVTNLLDVNIKSLQETYHIPLIISLSYPSAKGAISGCYVQMDLECIPVEDLWFPKIEFKSILADLDEQVAAYNTFLRVIQERSWITGVISKGYNPSSALQDSGFSINGKPASGVLWYWYPRLLGNIESIAP